MINGRQHKYGFGGKEYQDELNLDWYDVSARNYDPALGRWMNIDPNAENYLTLSPYSSYANNPISYMDPDGRDILFWQKDDKGKWQQVGFDKLNKEVQQSIEAFAKTKSGYSMLSKFAKKGDKIGSVEFENDGKYSKHEFSIGEFSRYGEHQAAVWAIQKDGDDKITVEWEINTAYKYDLIEDGIDVVANYSVTNGHETFLHLSQYLDELINAFDSGNIEAVKAIFEERKKESKE